MDENKPRRRWLSFGIRDLLWAMVVLGLGVALYEERGDRGRVSRMTLDWREMHRRGLMFREVEKVTVNYVDGSGAVYDRYRGVIIGPEAYSE